MKKFYIFIAIAIVLTVLAVLFVPGVDDFVEVTFQRYLGRAATQAERIDREVQIKNTAA